MSPIRLAALAVLAAPLAAQVEPAQSTTHPVGADSGFVANTSTSTATLGVPQVVWSTIVTVPNAGWLRLEYDGVLLAGSRAPGSDGSFVRITSLRDHAVQTQNLLHVGQWHETSAYFNGDSVQVELLAYPGTGDNRLVIRDVLAGPDSPAMPDTICGNTDDRVLSNDPRVARLWPVGCTGWMITDCNHCFLTAGHCSGSSMQIAEFNVPLSSASGAAQHPGPQDQYTIDTASVQTNGGLGTGNDWTYFGVHPNSTTGLTPWQANGGQAFDLLPTPPSVSGQTIRITGNGSTSSPVSPTWYLVQKTHTGPYASFTGTTVRYVVDTTGGNSGSPVILDGTNQAIAIHTHGGCTASGGSNIGTGSNHAALQAALASPQGVCACTQFGITFPNGQPNNVPPGNAATIRVRVGGGLGYQVGSLQCFLANGGSPQLAQLNQISGDTFDVVVPPALCGSQVSYWLTATEVGGAIHTSPTGAPAARHTALVANSATVLRDYDFETTPPGWSVANTALTAGAWTRGLPVDPQGPANDFDGSGQCWVTGNTSGQDVDGGPTRLTTETINLTGVADPIVRYALWFATDNVGDALVVEASNDAGATWSTVQTVTTTTDWTAQLLRVRDLFATPAQFAMRFSVADNPDNSITEAAIDAFHVDNATCSPATWVSVGAGCTSGASAPTLSVVSVPTMGSTMVLSVTGLNGGLPVMVAGLGLVVVPLPTPDFAANCWLRVRPDLIEVLPTTGTTATWSLPIPVDPTLYGLVIFEEAIELNLVSTTSQFGIATLR